MDGEEGNWKYSWLEMTVDGKEEGKEEGEKSEQGVEYKPEANRLD